MFCVLKSVLYIVVKLNSIITLIWKHVIFHKPILINTFIYLLPIFFSWKNELNCWKLVSRITTKLFFFRKLFCWFSERVRRDVGVLYSDALVLRGCATHQSRCQHVGQLPSNSQTGTVSRCLCIFPITKYFVKNLKKIIIIICIKNV